MKGSATSSADLPSIEELDEVQIHPFFSNHKAQIGANLDPSMRANFIDFLTQRHDCFSWSHEDMTGVDPELITHELHVDPSYKPIRQKRRKFAPERN